MSRQGGRQGRAQERKERKRGRGRQTGRESWGYQLAKKEGIWVRRQRMGGIQERRGRITTEVRETEQVGREADKDSTR